MKYLCTSCGSRNDGRLRGSVWITVLCVMFWLLPAIPYMIWRRTGPRRCTACNGFTLIPADSPRAKQLEGGAV